jgi:hypothetical protein
MRFVVGTVLQLLFGAAIGVLLGGIITGNENYWIALAIGFPLLITFGSIAGAAAASRQKKQDPHGLRPSVLSSIPGLTVARPAPPQPVLNPSSGVLLNGEPVRPATARATDAAGAAPASARPRGRAGWRLLSLLTIAAGAVLVLLPSAQVIAWTASDVVQGRPFDGRDMTVGLHQQEAFDQVAERMGGTEVVEIAFFPDHIDISAPTAPGARTVDRFRWRSGFASNEGPDYSQPADLGQALFDAGALDMSVVADVTRQSIADAALQGLDGVYPRIARAPEGGEPRISIALSGSYFDAYYVYSVDGELLDRSGTAFETD